MRAVVVSLILSAVLTAFLFIKYPAQLANYLSPQAPANLVESSQDYDTYENYGIYDNQLVSIPSYIAINAPNVLGTNASNKRIEVDLTNQRLYAYEGDRQVYNFLISSGKWQRTPVGTFKPWTRLRYTKMSGGSKALRTYYYLPNVPYVMYFYNSVTAKSRGYGLHGTYWHNNFGHPMSHGCINMKTEEAALIYGWIEIEGKDSDGTPIIIYGKAPNT